MKSSLQTWEAQHDPGLVVLRRALRAALVVPLLFFAVDRTAHNTTFTLFAAFGSLSTLLLVSFSGSKADRLTETGGMLLVELILIILGTTVSRILWLAVLLIAFVTFALLFLSILKPSVKKTVTPILVALILSITSPASAHAVPERLLAWSIAGAVSLLAIIYLWPTTKTGPSDEVAMRALFKAVRNIRSERNDRREDFTKQSRHAVRAAVAVGLAVLLANVLNAQHSFWVILGALTVLCSTAINTKKNVVHALSGTVIGIVIASGLIALIGTEATACWALLPCAILFTGIAPVGMSFMAGQIGFTTLLLLISNITTPIGWRVGLIRLEDIFIGCAVSLLVGALFWRHESVKMTSI